MQKPWHFQIAANHADSDVAFTPEHVQPVPKTTVLS